MKVCDGIPDCEDKSDEELCSDGEVSVNRKDSTNDDPMLQSCDGVSPTPLNFFP